MKTAKLTKKYDYYARGEKMTSYPAGYEGEMPDAHYEGAVKAGAVEGKAAEKPADKTGEGSTGTGGTGTAKP